MSDQTADSTHDARVRELEAHVAQLQRQVSDLTDAMNAHQKLFERLHAAGALPHGGGSRQ